VPCSSAAVHCGDAKDPPGLECTAWNRRWSKESWKQYLASGESPAELMAIRQCTHTGRPLGPESFIQSLEDVTQRRLSPQKGGRPKAETEVPMQAPLAF
jgi:hypothetical protein